MAKRLEDPNLIGETDGETEMQRLQKQIRKMEMERITFIEDKRNKQLKKEALITTLTNDRTKLKETLSTIQEGPHAKKCKQIEGEIKRKISQRDMCQKKYDEQKLTFWELETHIRTLEKKIEKLNTMQLTEKNYKEKISKGQRNLFKLENQLDVLSKKCDEVVNEISNLRQQIDHMLLDRSHFNDMWQKMVNKLEQGKKYIVELIDQSTTAYDQREELCNKIQTLKEKNQSESGIHKQEMRELQRKLDHDEKLQHFFSVKGQRRANSALESRETRKKFLQQNQLEKRIDNYWNLLDNIKQLAAEDDIEKLSSFYLKQQEENFALFNYVNELCYEVKNLGESVQQVQDDLDTQQDESDLKRQSQKDTIDVLEEECEFHSKELEQANAIQTNLNKQLNDLLAGVAKIFKFIPRSDAPILELLGSGKGITNKNVKLFLGIIKRQTNHIINCISFMDQTTRILAKKPRTPKFNIKHT